MSFDYNTVQNLGLAGAQQAPSARSELGQEAFLELMVTQLKNQDPLNPMENGEFLSQIAQFSTVTGIEELNSSFSGLSSSISADQGLQAANLVGRTVVVPADAAVLAAGGIVQGEISLPTSTPSLSVTITDSNGALVRRLDLSTQEAGQVPFSWDGLLEDGTYADPGLYQITAEANVGGEIKALATQVR
ncbi:MAG: flagellar hook assembly protein FlgD, partial [Gammaproteobacteria bacterium]